MKTIKEVIIKKNKLQLKCDLLWLDWENDRENRGEIKEKIDNVNKIISALEDLINALKEADVDILEEF